MGFLEIKRIETTLDSKYITIPLSPDALLNTSESDDSVIYRLYLIMNDRLEMKYFAEITGDTPEYSFSAYVKTTYVAAGRVREQIIATNRSSLLKKNPIYNIRCTLSNLYTNESIFRYSHIVSNEKMAYESMSQCITELDKVLCETKCEICI